MIISLPEQPVFLPIDLAERIARRIEKKAAKTGKDGADDVKAILWAYYMMDGTGFCIISFISIPVLLLFIRLGTGRPPDRKVYMSLRRVLVPTAL